jgi:hypothetical protein
MATIGIKTSAPEIGQSRSVKNTGANSASCQRKERKRETSVWHDVCDSMHAPEDSGQTLSGFAVK